MLSCICMLIVELQVVDVLENVFDIGMVNGDLQLYYSSWIESIEPITL